MAPPRPVPELFADAVTEILLRLPPDDPRCLFRASLVCKLWRHLATDVAFLRRYRRFHRTPPLLGFFCTEYNGYTMHRFIASTSASPFPQPRFNCHPWVVVDCRHGRVLLRNGDEAVCVHNDDSWEEEDTFTVWDPITGDREELPGPDIPHDSYSAAVLCAAAGCNHRDCHSGHSLVCVAKYGSEDLAHALVYSSQLGSWGTSVSVDVSEDDVYVNPSRGALVGDEIYFMFTDGSSSSLNVGGRILKYDLVRHHLSVIDPPESYDMGTILVPTEDDLLGVAGIRGSRLYLWSRMTNANEVEGWIQYRVIELRHLLPVDNVFETTAVIGFAEGVRAIFMDTNVGYFIIDLRSEEARKVSGPQTELYPTVPFMSFYTPDCACGKLPIPAAAN